MNYSRGKGDTFGGNGHFLVINDHFWVINDHFGGPSVHCGQILQNNPGKGQSLPPFWQYQDFVNILSPIPSLRDPEMMRNPTFWE